jgi:hypothetical protein
MRHGTDRDNDGRSAPTASALGENLPIVAQKN